MDEFQQTGEIHLDKETAAAIQKGFASVSISDTDTLKTIQENFRAKKPYLLDPHGAVAMAGARTLEKTYPPDTRILCLATAHPAKFPEITARALGLDPTVLDSTGLPPQAFHPSLIKASRACQELRICDCEHLESALILAMDEAAKKREHHG
jgi:threonine synthase